MSFNSNNADILNMLKSVIEGEDNVIANLSNASAVINQCMDNLNWAGFYLYDDKNSNLVLGPFQGKVACIRIPLGKGVCGTAFNDEKTILVKDVHEFPGHISCDERSNSEIVIPFKFNNGLRGVLDIDSPIKNRFSMEDKEILEQFVMILTEHHRKKY